MPSNSFTNSESEDTFATIVEGGKVYGDRIAAWVKAKAEHDAAFAQLQLGRATKNMLTEAAATKTAAEKTLADARDKGDKIVAEAMQKADGILQHGKDRLTAALANADAAQKEAADARASAAKYAFTVSAAADAKLAEASGMANSNNQRAQELAAAQKAADKAKLDAEATRAEFLNKHYKAVEFHKKLWG